MGMLWFLELKTKTFMVDIALNLSNFENKVHAKMLVVTNYITSVLLNTHSTLFCRRIVCSILCQAIPSLTKISNFIFSSITLGFSSDFMFFSVQYKLLNCFTSLNYSPTLAEILPLTTAVEVALIWRRTLSQIQLAGLIAL